ncbi:hypothetical protein D3C80_1883750 [compost metagenome]
MQPSRNEVLHRLDVVLLELIPRSLYLVLLMRRQSTLLGELFDPSLNHMAQALELTGRRNQ